MENKMICPFCGSEKVTKAVTEDGIEYYDCDECNTLYCEEDIEREDLRHKISALLADTSEENPFICDFPVGEDCDENCGLSSLDLPWIEYAFQASDGMILVKFDDNRGLTDIDDISLENLRDIYNGIMNFKNN